MHLIKKETKKPCIPNVSLIYCIKNPICLDNRLWRGEAEGGLLSWLLPFRLTAGAGHCVAVAVPACGCASSDPRHPPLKSLQVTLADAVGFERMRESTASLFAVPGVHPEGGHIYFTPFLRGSLEPIIQRL